MRKTFIYVPILMCATSSLLLFAEEREWAVRGQFLRFKEGRPDCAILRTDTGVLVDVPVASLSKSDQQFIKQLQASTAREADTPPVIKGPLGKELRLEVPQSLVAVESDAVFCRAASDAMQVYRMFLAKEDLPEDVRKAGEARLEHWRRLASEDRVRFGDRWIPSKERIEIARKTDDMIRHARELLRLGQLKLAGDELRKASRLDPESGKADFFLGWVYSLAFNEDDKAADHFREVIRREPENPWAYSNLAVSQLFCNESAIVAESFQRALETMPEPQVVADNMGVALALASRRALRIPEKSLKEVSDLYRRAIREMNLAPLPDGGTLRFTCVSPFGKAWEGEAGAASGPAAREVSELPADAIVEIGAGTGFVIAPSYILTNQHVVDGAETVSVLDPKDRSALLDATIVATTKESDLALLRCDGLTSPALPLRKGLPKRGTDIMVLGYPGGTLLGLELKTTRGSVVSQSDPSWGGLFMHSATINKGNSGGPIVDATGAVVGVVAAYTRREFIENTYSLGVPVDLVWTFVRDQVPGLEPVADGQELPWPEVDEHASQGTVFIQVKRRREASP